jgi:translocation and assembly module TamB
VELSSLLAPWPAVARLAQGPLEVHVRGRLGREWHGSADVVLERGKVSGVEVTAWRMPFTWAYAPREGRGEVNLRDSSAQLGTGRATAQATAQWGAGLRLEGQVRFRNVELRSVSRQLSDSGQLVSGRLTGRFDFRGSEVRSLDDLTGTLRATLGDTQALQAPALQQVAPFVGLPTSYAFQNGELSARLGRAVFRIDHLSLQSDIARMFVEGTVMLTGRLDLDVTAQTGAIGINRPALRLLQLRVPFTGNIPLTVLAEASSYLSNRVIHLRVTGTVRSPSISIQTGQLLAQEAVRFFLNRTNLPIP